MDHIKSDFQIREPRTIKCEADYLRPPESDEEVQLSTQINHTIKESLDNDSEFWYGKVTLNVICTAFSNERKDDELFRMTYSVECDIRTKKDAIDKDTFHDQFELIGLNTLVATARATIRGMLGVLNIEFPFSIPLLNTKQLVNLRKEHTKTN